jgi:predicted lipid-binding transport protein (Tim44 family)
MFRTAIRAAIHALGTIAVVVATIAFLASGADAAVGGGLSSGSRGMRTFTPPPATSTAPMGMPMQRTTAPPGLNSPGMPRFAPSTGGFFSRPGLLGGLAAGFLGAGLFGLLFGHGFMGGIGGIFSFLGLIFQIGLIAFLAMFLWRMFQRRSQPAFAGPLYRDNAPARPAMFGGLGSGAGPAQRSDDVGITGADYDAFERLLGEIQAAWSNEDVAKLHTLASPEMVSYFTEDLAKNKAQGDINKVSDVKLLQGDLAEAWREGETDYASVAMRFSLVDKTVERTTGRLVGGSEQPIEATEVWTFVRPRGANWELSAIQQA